MNSNFSKCNRKICKVALRLSEFDFDAIHCAGVKHQAVDALFCQPIDGSNSILLEDELSELLIDL